MTDKVLLNHRQMATAMRVNIDTLTAWRRQGCPYEVEGGRGREWLYDPDAVVAWRADELDEAKRQLERQEARVLEMQSELDLQGGGDEVAHLKPEARLKYYKAEQERMVTDLRRDMLVETRNVRQDYQETFAFLADRLQNLPDLLERRCGLAPDVVALMVAEIDQWQAELSERLEDEELDPNAVAA